MWGGFVEQQLCGVIAFRDFGHISLLFVKKEYHRQGIARRLFQTAVDYYKADGIRFTPMAYLIGSVP